MVDRVAGPGLKCPAAPSPLVGAGLPLGLPRLGGVRQEGAPVALGCTAPVAATFTLRQASPDAVVDRGVHRVGEALGSNRTPAAHRLGELVLECPRREKQIGVVLRTQRMSPPVLIGVQNQRVASTLVLISDPQAEARCKTLQMEGGSFDS